MSQSIADEYLHSVTIEAFALKFAELAYEKEKTAMPNPLSLTGRVARGMAGEAKAGRKLTKFEKNRLAVAAKKKARSAAKKKNRAANRTKTKSKKTGSNFDELVAQRMEKAKGQAKAAPKTPENHGDPFGSLPPFKKPSKPAYPKDTPVKSGGDPTSSWSSSGGGVQLDRAGPIGPKVKLRNRSEAISPERIQAAAKKRKGRKALSEREGSSPFFPADTPKASSKLPSKPMSRMASPEEMAAATKKPTIRERLRGLLRRNKKPAEAPKPAPVEAAPRQLAKPVGTGKFKAPMSPAESARRFARLKKKKTIINNPKGRADFVLQGGVNSPRNVTQRLVMPTPKGNLEGIASNTQAARAKVYPSSPVSSKPPTADPALAAKVKARRRGRLRNKQPVPNPPTPAPQPVPNKPAPTPNPPAPNKPAPQQPAPNTPAKVKTPADKKTLRQRWDELSDTQKAAIGIGGGVVGASGVAGAGGVIAGSALSNNR